MRYSYFLCLAVIFIVCGYFATRMGLAGIKSRSYDRDQGSVDG